MKRLCIVLVTFVMLFVGCTSNVTADMQLSELERLSQWQLRVLRNSALASYRKADLPSVITEEQIALIEECVRSDTEVIEDDVLRIRLAIKKAKEVEPYEPQSLQLTPLSVPFTQPRGWEESLEIRNWRALDHQALTKNLPSNWRKLLLDELMK